MGELMKRKRQYEICHDCKNKPAKHVVMHGEIDTGVRLCCACMDRLMLRLSHEAKTMLEGVLGLDKFRREHIIQCGFDREEDLRLRAAEVSRRMGGSGDVVRLPQPSSVNAIPPTETTS